MAGSMKTFLLIFDNHASCIPHVIYKYCKTNNINMLYLTTEHVSLNAAVGCHVYGPLKTTYKKECDNFMKSRLAEKRTPYDVAVVV